MLGDRMHRNRIFSAVIVVTLFASPALAHYPWIKIDQKQGKQGTVLFYFEHAPKAGDGAYLDPFVQRGTCWLTTAGGESAEVVLEDTKQDKLRWLQAELTTPAPRCVDLYAKWGVYRYGQTDTLLHYYARNLDARDAADVTKLSQSKHLKLQLQPKIEGGELIVRVTWEGKPLAGQQVTFRSPTVAKSFKTDDGGVAILPVDRAGNYSVRTKMPVKEEGEFQGKAYAEVHHHSTLTMHISKAYAAE